MSDEKKKNAIEEIEEEELEKVAGGIGATADCWFKHHENGYTGETQKDGIVYMKCYMGSCFGLFTQCACHGTDRCENKMHKMDVWHTKTNIGNWKWTSTVKPHPYNLYNHESKTITINF